MPSGGVLAEQGVRPGPQEQGPTLGEAIIDATQHIDRLLKRGERLTISSLQRQDLTSS